MKVYEYLAEVFANNDIDVEEINSSSVVYLKIDSKSNHATWRIVRKELRSTDGIPINPMHIEEWDDDIDNIYRVQDSKREELVMHIIVALSNGNLFDTMYCTNPRRTPMILID